MSQEVIDSRIGKEYSAGFVTDIESDTLPPGLDEDVIRFISAKKGEPEWLLEWRLEAYRDWLAMEPPSWAHVALSADRPQRPVLLLVAEEHEGRPEEPR
jgi:Fe-S cluster assembly protein SufB